MATTRVISLTDGGLLCLLVCLLVVCPPYAITCPDVSDCSCDAETSCLVCPRGISASLPLFWRLAVFFQEVECLQILDGQIDELLYLVHFKMVKRLELHGYYIPSLTPDALRISTVSNMTHLDLSSNSIHTVSEDMFIDFHELMHLDLGKNSIFTFPPKAFENLAHLQYLSLHGNALISLPLFTNQRELAFIDIGHNHLTYIHHYQFRNLTSLQNLHLEYNNLKAIPDDVVDDFSAVQILSLHNNLWDCSCSIARLATLLQNRSKASTVSNLQNMTCQTPARHEGTMVSDLTSKDKNCSIPVITSVSKSQNLIVRSTFTINCNASGEPTPAILWITPLGELFGHTSQYHLLGHERLGKVFEEHTYVGIEKVMVSIGPEGRLTIEGMRGALVGNYTCVAVNPSGEDLAVVHVTIHSKIPDTFERSLILSAELTGAFFVLGFMIGIITFAVNKCRTKLKKQKNVLPGNIEEGSEVSEERNGTLEDMCHSADSYFDDETPPGGASPFLSAGKCRTPTGEEYDKFSLDFSERMSETLDEVRWRLRHGYERKMEKVRSHVLTIKSSGSQYIDTIRSSSSLAANRVRAGVVMGMVQVKYGVQSIKEFCGTGDMRTQTISTISVSTDVDTQESTCTEVIRTTTFV